MGPSDAALDPLGGALFAEDVHTHIPRGWAVDDDEDFADAEVRQEAGRMFSFLRTRELMAMLCFVFSTVFVLFRETKTYET